MFWDGMFEVWTEARWSAADIVVQEQVTCLPCCLGKTSNRKYFQNKKSHRDPAHQIKQAPKGRNDQMIVRGQREDGTNAGKDDGASMEHIYIYNHQEWMTVVNG